MNVEKEIMKVFKKEFPNTEIELTTNFKDMKIDSLSLLGFFVSVNDSICPEIDFLSDDSFFDVNNLSEIAEKIKRSISFLCK